MSLFVRIIVQILFYYLNNYHCEKLVNRKRESYRASHYTRAIENERLKRRIINLKARDISRERGYEKNKKSNKKIDERELESMLLKT
jgi:hypothetical protein